MTEENYKDRNGNPTSLEELCRTDPEWSCSTIRNLRAKLKSAERERHQILAWIRDQPYQLENGIAEIADGIERGEYREIF